MTFDTVGTGRHMAFLQCVFLGGSSNFLVARMLYHIQDTGEKRYEKPYTLFSNQFSNFYYL